MARPLKIFMRGSRVTRLQHLLARKGYEIEDAPGLFGTSTRSAVKQMQQSNGLEATGIADDCLFALFGEGAPAVNGPTQSPASGASDIGALQARIDMLTQLLLDKGIITASELDMTVDGRAQKSSTTSATSSPPGIGKPLF